MRENTVEKKVVTCFLESGGKILILRRSAHVGTYQDRWGGVSGYLDAGQDEQALTEIKEETGLLSNDVKIIKHGEPLRVEDKTLGVIWVVHPYLFHIQKPDKIHIDWEHTEIKWIKPAEIKNYETVPALAEALARVWAE